MGGLRKKKRASNKRKDVKMVMGLIEQTQGERGHRNEEIAGQVLSQLKQDGYLQGVWIIPSFGVIDRMGVDVICQKSGEESGYYFINVKSSQSGVLNFLEKQRLLMLDSPETTLYIYPLLIRSGEDPAVIKSRLFSEIFSLEPSCEVLPEKIQKYLDDLANSRATNENQLWKQNSDRAKEQRRVEEDEKILKLFADSISSRQKIQHLLESNFCQSFRITNDVFRVGRGAKTKIVWEAKASLLFRGKLLKAVCGGGTKSVEDQVCAAIIADIASRIARRRQLLATN